MIRSFRSTTLKRYWEKSEVDRVPTDWAEKILQLLDLLDKARKPEDMAVPGLFYSYPEGTKGRYAVMVSKGWRISFGWKSGEAVEVDLEQVH